jgi:quercetin dioxygenase-like cupin family protein
MYFYNINQMVYQPKRAGVYIKGISGENVQMLFIKLEPGFISDHSHPHEQMGQVMCGEVELTIASETKKCGVGDLYYIPSNVPHSFKVLSAQAVEILDIFSPPKEENRL